MHTQRQYAHTETGCTHRVEEADAEELRQKALHAWVMRVMRVMQVYEAYEGLCDPLYVTPLCDPLMRPLYVTPSM